MKHAHMTPEMRQVLRDKGVKELWRCFPDRYLSREEKAAIDHKERKELFRRHMLSLWESESNR